MMNTMRFISLFITLGALIVCKPTWGKDTDPPSIPPLRDRLFTKDYRKIELRYDPNLPQRAPYPKTQQQVIDLYHQALNENNEDDNYVLFSFFRTGCSDFNGPNYSVNAQEECSLANFFLARVLNLNPTNGLALFYMGQTFNSGDAGEINTPKAVEYYEKAYHLYSNSLIPAAQNLFVIYMHGIGGVPQDFDKAKYYLEKVAADNPKGIEAYDLRNFDTHVDMAKLLNESDRCKQKDPNNREWRLKCTDEMDKKREEYIKKYQGTERARNWQENPDQESSE